MRYCRSLDRKSWNSFLDFCHSPYFNKQREPIRLLEVLDEFYPDFNSPELDKKALGARLYPGKDGPKQLSYAASSLVQLFEEFARQREFESDKAGRERLRLKAFDELELHADFESGFGKMEAASGSFVRSHPDHSYESYRLLELADRHFLQHTRSRKHLHLAGLAERQLDHFYLVQKMRYANALRNRQTVLSQQYDLPVMELIEEFSRKMKRDDMPLLELYRLTYLMQSSEESETHYHKLSTLFREQLDALDMEIRQEIATYLLNYCTRRINKGELAYFEEIFELYQLGLEHGFLLEDGKLRPALFKNIVSSGLRLKRFDWASGFIREYGARIERRFREKAVQYNQAAVYFEKGDYDDALPILLTTNFGDPFYALGARSMLLRILYEESDWDTLQSQLTAFAAYLRRNKSISEYQKKVHQNLIRLLRKLTGIPQHQKHALKKLKAEIGATKQIAYLGWLNRMVDAKLSSEPSRASDS